MLLTLDLVALEAKENYLQLLKFTLLSW